MQPCLVCGTLFKPRQKNSLYCLPKCRNKAWKVRNRMAYLEAAKQQMRRTRARVKLDRQPILINCPICGTRFEQNIHHPEQVCCSSPCNSKYYRKNNPEQVNAAKRKNNALHKEHLAAYNARYKDLLRFSGNRLKALKRDNYTCTSCKYVAPTDPKNGSEDVIVHHIDFSGQTPHPNNRIENLTTLCRPCHIRLHTHKVVHNR